MAKQTRAQLIALLNSKILTGGNRTKAQDIRDFENAIIESVVNILDGENLPDGYMGIDPAGFADPSFIKAPSPIGYFLKDDGTWDAAGGAPLGKIKIVDLAGDFFTDLATASAYVATFNVAGIISDESYYPIGSGGIYYFTVPQGSDFSGADYFLAETSAITMASIIDDLGLITNFANYAFRRSNNKIILGDCTFGDNAFYLCAAEKKLGDCTFGDNAFFNLYKEVTIGSITLTNPSYDFAKNSVGKFYINKQIGASTAAEYPNFFSTSVATIFARKAAYTNNAGGIEGDLQTAIANGANVQFEGIDLEKVSNKSTSIVTDQASNIKYPSVKSVYDWAISVFSPKATLIDYSATSTYTGWSVFTIQKIFGIDYPLYTIWTVEVSGVSDSAFASVTIPVAHNVAYPNIQQTCLVVSNGVASAIGRVRLDAGMDTISWATSASGGGFINSGTKTVRCQITIYK